MTITEPAELSEVERRLVQAEVVVQDAHDTSQHLVERLAALRLHGVPAAQAPSKEALVLSRLLAADAVQFIVEDLLALVLRAEKLFTTLETDAVAEGWR